MRKSGERKGLVLGEEKDEMSVRNCLQHQHTAHKSVPGIVFE